MRSTTSKSNPHFEIFKADINNKKGIVLLGHAMFNNPEYYSKPRGKSFVDYLVSNGYEVVVISLTGYRTEKAHKDTNFDTYVEDNLKVIETIGSEQNIPLYYIGHSLGGLAGLSAILQSKLKFEKIILIAPAVWGFTNPGSSIIALKQKIKIYFSQKISAYLGYLPSKLFKLGDINAPHGYFYQFNKWIKESRITAQDKNLDYQILWNSNTIPTYIFQAEVDLQMAPPENISWISKNVGESTSIIKVDKYSFGYSSNHFSIIYGKDSASKVWNKIIKLLGEKNEF